MNPLQRGQFILHPQSHDGWACKGLHSFSRLAEKRSRTPCIDVCGLLSHIVPSLQIHKCLPIMKANFIAFPTGALILAVQSIPSSFMQGIKESCFFGAELLCFILGERSLPLKPTPCET